MAFDGVFELVRAEGVFGTGSTRARAVHRTLGAVFPFSRATFFEPTLAGKRNREIGIPKRCHFECAHAALNPTITRVGTKLCCLCCFPQHSRPIYYRSSCHAFLPSFAVKPRAV